MTDNEAPLYYVWGADRIVYGPVELPTLVGWIQDERVVADTWLFTTDANLWSKAAALAELQVLFKRRTPTAPTASRISAKALRQIKILANLEERALESFLRYMQPVDVAPFSVVVRPGEPADAMYFVVEGEMRAYVVIDGKESTLATLQAGDTFGEIALLDKGERTAFVAANVSGLLLRLPAANFDQITREAPALATPFTLGLARLLAARLRSLSKRFEDSIRFSRTAAGS